VKISQGSLLSFGAIDCAALIVPRRFLCCVVVLLLAIVMLPASLQAAMITVTSTADNIAIDGVVTLREAIASINAAANSNADVVAVGAYGSNDTINFNIPGSGVHSIALSSALPLITEPLTINGYTQGSSSANTLTVGDNAVLQIFLNGAAAGSGAIGLVLSNHSGSVISGLAIGNFSGSGIEISSGGGSHLISGNFVGISADGSSAAGNGGSGIKITAVPNNTIGGTTAAARNIISANGQGNVFGGVEIDNAGASDNLIAGNYIGVDATGTVALGNSTAFGFGVIIFNAANANTVGGLNVGAGNLISANGDGISVQAADSNIVQGNLVGLNAAGNTALGNKFNGVTITGTAKGNIVGGASASARNVISGNKINGVALGGCFGGSSIVQGNFIGTDSLGIAPLPNGATGVHISSDHHDAMIGGTSAGTGNVIAFNGASGVSVITDNFCGSLAINNAILGNSIFGNTSLGIDLGTPGVTPNDVGDTDIGANNLQNFPLLTTATSAVGSTSVAGSLNSTANTSFRVEFFSSASCDPSGNGQGQTFLGFSNATTDGSGNAVINATLPVATPMGWVMTTTATDPDGNTSEFSACMSVFADTVPPSVTINQAALQADPAYTTPIFFTVVFSKPVTGFTGTDISFAGSTAGSMLATVTGSGANYTVSVAGMTGPGIIVASIPAGAAMDASSNPSLASTSTDNAVTYAATPYAPVTIPVLNWPTLLLLAVLLLGLAARYRRV
jgi:hypothetical protein